MIDKATIDELVTLRADARLSAENFSEAIKAQAEAHEIAKGALRRYICAREKGSMETLNEEQADLESLLNGATVAAM
jgi:hypothetical protein